MYFNFQKKYFWKSRNYGEQRILSYTFHKAKKKTNFKNIFDNCFCKNSSTSTYSECHYIPHNEHYKDILASSGDLSDEMIKWLGT